MKITRNKLIAAGIILAALVFAFFLGGGRSGAPAGGPDGEITALATLPQVIQPAASAPAAAPESTAASEPTAAPETEPSAPPATQPEALPTTQAAATTQTAASAPPTEPAPVEPQDTTTGDTQLACTISVRCDTVLANLSLLDPNKAGLVPDDGVILAPAEAVFYDGESVFNVLQREMKARKIHMEHMTTPVYNSAYIEGIGNIYELDCGELSGWLYKVNGLFPGYGSSRHPLSDGDVIEWVYSCDLGRDVGADPGTVQRDE